MIIKILLLVYCFYNHFLFMSTILYNQLDHIGEAKNHSMTKVPLILEVIKKYNFHKNLGVNRLHKHFDLQKDQIVLWSLDENGKKTSKTSTLKGSPLVLAFQQEQWKPTEFYSGQNIWEKLQSEANFLSLIKQIEEIIGEDRKIYGLTLKIWENKGPEIELTDERERTQTIQLNFEKQSCEQVITNYWTDLPNSICFVHSVPPTCGIPPPTK